MYGMLSKKMYVENIWTHEGPRLILPNNVVSNLQSYKQLAFDVPESGGLLLGRRIIGTQDGIIDEITAPMAGDVQKRAYFFRGQGHVRRQGQYWKETTTTGQLLGVWHTHPEPIPTPSTTDLQDWKNVLKKCGDPKKPQYFVIVGQEQICVWIGVRRKLLPPQFLPCVLEGGCKEVGDGVSLVVY
jgi:integrative and conjugative element protein (TIGR02256 family)